MTERPHELGDIKGVGHFEAKFRLKGYLLTNIYGPLNGGMVVLQPYRWTFSHKETL